MLLSLFARRSGRLADPKPPAPSFFRPRLEGFEDRTVPANLLNITDVDLSGLNIANGILTAAEGTVEGTLAGLPFTTDITNFALDLLLDAPAGACSILSLELAPIDLDLLGLHVDNFKGVIRAMLIRRGAEELPPFISAGETIAVRGAMQHHRRDAAAGVRADDAFHKRNIRRLAETFVVDHHVEFFGPVGIGVDADVMQAV